MVSRTSDARKISRVRTVMSNDQIRFNMLKIINKKKTNHKADTFSKIQQVTKSKQQKKLKKLNHVNMSCDKQFTFKID